MSLVGFGLVVLCLAGVGFVIRFLFVSYSFRYSLLARFLFVSRSLLNASYSFLARFLCVSYWFPIRCLLVLIRFLLVSHWSLTCFLIVLTRGFTAWVTVLAVGRGSRLGFRG